MAETRPEMTRAEFDAAAAYAYEGHWLTGEECFVHVSTVMEVEGWNRYGHIGYNRLTEPQRVLMMWSDLVGQTANGGFTQFCDNYDNALELAHPYIEKLGWPELFERFDPACREQAGDPERPQLKRKKWGDVETARLSAKREQIIAQLARKASRWRPWTRRREEASYAQFSDILLTAFYNRAVEAGEIVPDDEPELEREENDVPSGAAQAFDKWFYLDTTMAASRTFVGDYIRRNRDSLCRLID